MKNPVTSLFRFVLSWFGSARRAQPQERITPEQLRKALTEMLADPQTRRLVLGHALGTAFPIEGGVTSGTPGRIAKFAANGTDLEDSIVHQSGDNITGKVGIGTTAPGRKLEVRETGINVVAARLAGLGTPPDYNRNVALSFHPRVDFLTDNDNDDGARIEAQLTGGFAGSVSADLALQTRAAGTLSTTMLLQAGGNVGIGTLAPGARLDVVGGGVRSQGPAGGNHAFLGSFANGTFTNWLLTGDNATFYNLLGGPDQASGFGVAEGPNIVSPIVWMYAAGGRNMFDVRSVGYQQNPTAGTSLFTVRESGNVGLGTTTPGARLDVVGGGVRSQGPAGGNHAFLGSFVNGTFSNWLGTGLSADFYNLLGGPDQHAGFGVAQGDSIISPIVWMYSYGGRNMFDVRSVGFQQNPTAGTSLFTVRESGNVGLGTTTPQGILDIAGKTVFLKPSPTGDDTAQINTAMSNLEASGGIIYLTPGTYNVTNLTGKSNVHLWGSGVGATSVKFTSSAVGGAMIKFEAKSNFSIRNIQWNFNNVVNGKFAIWVSVDGSWNPSSNFAITDCSVINVDAATSSNRKYGIFAEGAYNFLIERNYVKFAPSREPNQAIVTAGTVNTSDPLNPVVVEVYDGIINANHCHGAGIQADGRDKMVTNNLVHDFQFGGGITVNSDVQFPNANHDNVITGNTIYNGTGNDVTGTWCAGIENWGERTLISGNICHDNAGNGIHVGGQKCIVTDNICYDNGKGTPNNPDTFGIDIYYLDSTFNANESVYVGNRCFDTRAAGSKTQTYGLADVRESSLDPYCDRVTIGINQLLGNKDGEADIRGSNYAMFLAISGGAVALSAPPSPPADSDLSKSNISFYLLEGSNELKVKVKYSNGAVKTGTIGLL